MVLVPRLWGGVQVAHILGRTRDMSASRKLCDYTSHLIMLCRAHGRARLDLLSFFILGFCTLEQRHPLVLSAEPSSSASSPNHETFDSASLCHARRQPRSALTMRRSCTYRIEVEICIEARIGMNVGWPQVHPRNHGRAMSSLPCFASDSWK